MSDFTAKFQAILDTSKIPSQIAGIEKTPIVLSNFVLDSKNISSQIQGVLDGHKFTIKLDGIKTENADAQAKKAGASYSKVFAEGVRTQLSNGGIEASIAKVTSQFERVGTSGHKYLSVIGDDIKKLNTLQGDMLGNIQNSDALVKTYNEFSKTLANVKNNLVTVSASTRTFASQLQISTLGNSMTTWLAKNPKAVAQYGATISDLQSRLKALGANVPISELNRLVDEFNQAKSAAKAAGLAGDSFVARLKRSFKNVVDYVGITSIVHQGIDTLRDMAKNVVAVDTAMTGLYRVTDLTNDQYKQLYQNMAASAKAYGAELSKVIDSTTNWSKLGFNVNEAKGLAEITTMYQQVADLDTKVAVNNLVTAYKGFEKQLLELSGGSTVNAVEYIADVFNKLGNEFAVEASDIGAALNNCASTLEMAGNTIQETAAMATGMIEVNQDPEKSGSALKILSLRLRGMKGELEAIGEEVDEDIISLSKMQTQILNLTGGKVNIFNNDGTFKSTYEIMDAIADVYERLLDTDQAELLEVIAGKNRSNEVAALLSNWEQVENAMESATNAAGTARKEYEIFLDSAQAHLNQFETSWQKLSVTVLDSGFLKGVIDFGTGTLDLLDGIISRIGVLPTLMTAISAASSFNGVGELINQFQFRLCYELNMPTKPLLIVI